MNESNAHADRRWALRRTIDLTADVMGPDGARFPAKIMDISEEGCMLRTWPGCAFDRNRLYTIKVTGLSGLFGYVIWSAEGRTGIAFGEPLHPANVQSLVMKSHYSKISRHLAGRRVPKHLLGDLPPLSLD